MKHAVEFKGFEPNEAIRKLVEDLVARLERRNRSFSSNPVFLRFLIEEIPPHKLYTISITLDVPQETLAAKQQTHDAEAGIRTAFAEIERQMESYKARMRREHLWKRMAKREQLRRMKIAPEQTPTPGD